MVVYEGNSETVFGAQELEGGRFSTSAFGYLHEVWGVVRGTVSWSGFADLQGKMGIMSKFKIKHLNLLNKHYVKLGYYLKI